MNRRGFFGLFAGAIASAAIVKAEPKISEEAKATFKIKGSDLLAKYKKMPKVPEIVERELKGHARDFIGRANESIVPLDKIKFLK